MHAYLRGAGIEAQANSDNTLRGGLTPKHVDIAELLRILDFEPSGSQVIEPEPVPTDSPYCAGARTWRTPAREFALFEWQLDGTDRALQATGPSILLCLEGTATLRGAEESIVLRRGDSAYLAAGEPTATASGPGRLVHITVGQVARSR